jgi:hypothetical protein
MKFEDLVWRNDRMLMGDLVFRLQHYISDEWELGDKCFVFYKIKPLVDQYAKLFASMPGFRVKNMLELGLWDGGSTAFWFELLQPDKYVGLDVAEREDSAYFRAYAASRGIADRIRTSWGTDQADAKKLRSLVTGELSGSLNFVIDDASHQYEPTKRSFEILFPWVEPGGLYLIEDWAWAHWPEFQAKSHPWADKTPLTKLVVDLVEAAGSWQSSTMPKLIESITVFQGFAVAERGHLQVVDPESFTLERYISRRPSPSMLRRAQTRLKQALDRHILWRFR